MIRSIIIFVSLIIAVPVFSQFNYTETRNLADFNEIKVFGNIKATLIKSDSNRVVLTSDSLDLGEVSTETDRNLLIISNTAIGSENKIFVNVYFKNLDYIISDAGAYINFESMIVKDNIEIEVKNGAIFRAEFDSKNLILTCGIETECYLLGFVENSDIVLRNGAELNAQKLVSKNMKISALIGSKATINVTDKLEAKATLESQIYYLKKPKEVSQSVNLGGIIKMK